MTTATHISQSDLESYLWGAATLLRGYIDAGDYKQYIFPLLFYKRLCDVYNEELAAEKEAEEASRRRYIGQAKITAYTSHPSENGGYNVTATGMTLSGNEWKIVAG